jgi:HPt (histidine-containing phosphotransfer) domain-containing protein
VIAGVDAQSGLTLYGGDAEIYKELLRSFVDSASVFLEKIRTVSIQTLPDYAISVHEIKGASASIGADGVSRKAESFEKLSKNGDSNGVLARNDAFIAELSKLIDDIKTWNKTNA